MLYPKPSGRWPHDGNRYTHTPDHMQLSDFPAFNLNMAVVSERAASLLRHAGLIEDLVPMTVSGAPFFAIQPQQSDAFQPDRSRGLQLAGGQTFFYYSRVFNESRVTGEFFAIPSLEPFSDLFITGRLVDAVNAAGLTGLEYVELVYDNGPVEPVYPAIDRATIPEYTNRHALEYELLYRRCSLWNYDPEEIRTAVYDAVSKGVISFDYVPPEYRRHDANSAD